MQDQRSLVTENHRDYLNFKLKNVAEIRALLLQLASVAAVIVAGILALNNSGLNYFVILSLCCLVSVGGLAAIYVLTLLENLDKEFRKTIVDSETRINDIVRKESAFIDSPSVTAASELKNFYAAQRDELSKNQLAKLKSDWKVWALSITFLIGLAFLAVGYFYQNWNVVTTQHGRIKISSPTASMVAKSPQH